MFMKSIRQHIDVCQCNGIHRVSLPDGDVSHPRIGEGFDGIHPILRSGFDVGWDVSHQHTNGSGVGFDGIHPILPAFR
jgi:hypothetical protein